MTHAWFLDSAGCVPPFPYVVVQGVPGDKGGTAVPYRQGPRGKGKRSCATADLPLGPAIRQALKRGDQLAFRV
jgi:hypothetical protein